MCAGIISSSLLLLLITTDKLYWISFLPAIVLSIALVIASTKLKEKVLASRFLETPDKNAIGFEDENLITV